MYKSSQTRVDIGGNIFSLAMLLSSFRRPRRIYRSWLRTIAFLSCTALAIDFILNVAIIPPSRRTSVASTLLEEKDLPRRERVYIASMHWNNENIIRSRWSAAVLDLVAYFGADNVYVSIIESGSWDDTKGALRDLDAELEKVGVERNIEMFDRTHEDEIQRIPEAHEEGWIWTSRGRKELRRIPFLAGIRNQVMAELKQLAERTNGKGRRSFDKILWLNDVIFTACIASFP